MATGYIYLSSLEMAYHFVSLKFQPIRYEVENADDVIMYIHEETNSIKYAGQTINTHGNQYYLLSKSAKNIKLNCTKVFVRDGFYDSDQMDFLQIDGSIFNINTFTNYSMGGSGTNGIIDGTGFTVGYNDNVYVPIQGTLGHQTNGRTASVTLTESPSTTGFIIGAVSTKNPDYVCRANNIIYSVSNFFNKYSSKYYSDPKAQWWKDMIDLRTFYKVHQMYYGGTLYQTEFEELETGEVFDGFPLFLNIHTTHDIEKARKYLNDGTIPDDDTYIESDDGEPPIPQDSGGDSDDMDGMNNTDHTDSQSIINSPTNHYYILDSVGLQHFTNWFWNDILTSISEDYSLLGDYAVNLLTNAYGDLNKYVVSLRKLSVDIDKFFKRSTSNEIIQLGRYELNYHCDTIFKDVNSMPLLAEYRVPMKHATTSNSPTIGNFLDFPPYTSVSLYIPFIGIVPIDGNMVVGRTIRIYGAVDVIAGTIHYNVYVQTPSKEWSLIGSYEGKCGVDIPLALDNSMQNSTNILKGVADVTIGMCTKSMPNLLSIGNGIFSEPINNLGANTTNTTYFNPDRCALIMQSAIGFVPGNFSKTVGHLYCKSEKLDNLSGLTICNNVRINEYSDTVPTDTEVSEIYSLMESGIII